MEESMEIPLINEAYHAGESLIFSKLNQSDIQEEMEKYYAQFFVDLSRKIKQDVDYQLHGSMENGKIVSPDILEEYSYAAIDKALREYDISPYTDATVVEVSLQFSFLMGYLRKHEVVDKDVFFFELHRRGGPQPISDWIYSFIGLKHSSMTLEQMLENYFNLYTRYPVHITFRKIDLTEDAFYTGHRKDGTSYVYHTDDDVFGNKEILGGSYEAVKHFSDGKIHDVHHLIPVKLLNLTGILKEWEGPCIRMEKKDHATTESYGNKSMLKNDYILLQLEYLKAKDIHSAVELEIADIRAKFGSKYEDAIRDVMKYVSQLEKKIL